jgi:hypothetical protein
MIIKRMNPLADMDRIDLRAEPLNTLPRMAMSHRTSTGGKDMIIMDMERKSMEVIGIMMTRMTVKCGNAGLLCL